MGTISFSSWCSNYTETTMNFVPKISQISPRIIRIIGCNPGPMTLQGTNTYLIGTGSKRILLDTGDGLVPEYIDLLSSVLTTNQITLEHIVLTHWHPDHVGGVDEIQKLSTQKTKVSKFPIKEHPSDYDVLFGGEELNTEGASLKVYHTPGHTTDHIILHLKDKNTLFSGDCILGEGTTVFEDLFDYMKSLDTILDLQPEIICPGHGPCIKDPIPRIKYYIGHRNERERQILELLSSDYGSKHSPFDIVKILYKDLDTSLYGAAEHNVQLHLKKLEKEGKVRSTSTNCWSSL